MVTVNDARPASSDYSLPNMAGFSDAFEQLCVRVLTL